MQKVLICHSEGELENGTSGLNKAFKVVFSMVWYIVVLNDSNNPHHMPMCQKLKLWRPNRIHMYICTVVHWYVTVCKGHEYTYLL